MTNQIYWKYRNSNKKYAEQWVREMETMHSDLIQASYNQSKIIRPNAKIENNKRPIDCHTKISIWTTTTEHAIQSLIADCNHNGAVALNFASFRNPGGQFLQGSSAQEESLCRCSTLFPVLRKFNDTYYRENRNHLNKGLYDNSILYTPSIWFEFRHLNNPVRGFCDVITCAAPNRGAAKRNGVPDVIVQECMINRIRRILEISRYMNRETLILGAFGCGVFRNDAMIVANIFHQLLYTEFCDVFSKVIFAIPSNYEYDYNSFKTVFEF